jgi:hypothetical protein
MNTLPRSIALLFATVLLAPASAAEIRCHIHLPAEHPAAGGKPTIVQDVGDPRRCEQLNAERYDGEGRCHCGFGLQPGRPSAPAGGDVPAGPPPGLP